MAKTKPGKIKATEQTAKVIERVPKVNYRVDLAYLDNIASKAPLSRQGHVQTQTAVHSLSRALVELDVLKVELEALKKQK